METKLPVVIGEAEPWEGGGIDCSGLDRRSEGIPHNASMIVFVSEGTVVATGGHFVKILDFC